MCIFSGFAKAGAPFTLLKKSFRSLIEPCIAASSRPFHHYVENKRCVRLSSVIMASPVPFMDLNVRRRQVKRPILRCKLVSFINSFSDVISNSTVHHNFPNSILPSFADQPHILDNVDTALFFGEDVATLKLFQECNGMLIRTSFARQFALKYRILGDWAFWHFWEIIAMQSGWSVIDVKGFNDQFNSGCYTHICLVTRMPSVCSRSSNHRCTSFCSLHADPLSSCDVVYTAFSEITTILCKKKFNVVGIYGDRPRHRTRTHEFSDEQVRMFRYQIDLLRRMIKVRYPIVNILCLLLDVYTLVTCLSKPVPSDFDACNISSSADLLEFEIRHFIESILVEDVKSLFDEIDKVIL